MTTRRALIHSLSGRLRRFGTGQPMRTLHASASREELVKALHELDYPHIGLRIKSSPETTLELQQLRPGKEIQRNRQVPALVQEHGAADIPFAEAMDALTGLGETVELRVDGEALWIGARQVAFLPNDFMRRPPPREESVPLHSESTRKGTRTVWLRKTVEGELLLEGQDLGTQVSEHFGPTATEYEWAWSLAPERVRTLLASLDLASTAVSDLERLAHRLRKLDPDELENRFERAGGTFWSRVGE